LVAHAGAHDLIRAIEAAGRPWAIVTASDRRLAAARLGASRHHSPRSSSRATS
jgi:sugar-phosphatase